MGLLGRLRRAVRRAPPPRLDGAGKRALDGRCNVCGFTTRFFYDDPALYRESLVCAHCLTTSRYRSMARGLLEVFERLAGVRAASLADLPAARRGPRLAVYDTQVPFDAGGSAYPVPDLLARCGWIELSVSRWKPDLPAGAPLAARERRVEAGAARGGETPRRSWGRATRGPGFDKRRSEGRASRGFGPRVTNQNLERLTFPDASFDVVLTSDVMEHVRLEEAAHREIRRVLRPGGFYLFTVPHFRDRTTIERVRVVDPADPSRDVDVLPREYHGDANAEDGRALAYRSFGTDLDEKLVRLGFEVAYTKRDFPELGILNTELFSCRVVGPAITT